MIGKFACEREFNCVIPQGFTNQEIEEHQLPHSCLECEYYTLETKEGKFIPYPQWIKENKTIEILLK